MKHAIAAAISAIAIMACIAGCAMAVQEDTAKADDREFTWATDRYFEPRVPSGAVRIAQEVDERTAQAQSEPISDEETSEWYYEPEYYDYGGYAPSQGATRGNPDGLNNFDGVFDYGGRHETYYSADNAVYRDQLTVDDQGFYRDGEGRYAVAVSDMPEGTVFQGSQGECVVVDSGCEPGTTDYAVSGW